MEQELLQFFFHTNNLPFAITGCVLIGLVVIEILTSLIGFHFLSFIDNLLPDIDLSIDVDNMPTITKVFGWLRIDNVPLMILFLAFLFLYTVFGFTVQRIMFQTIHQYIYWWLIAWPVILLTIPFLKMTSSVLSKIVIKDETTAITIESLEGGIAIITVGIAKKGSPAEAKIVDKFKHTHYVRVEPETGSFKQGDQVFLMKYERSNLFTVTEVPDELRN